MALSRGDAFLFATCFSEPLGYTHLGQFWPPLMHPWSDVIDSLEDLSSNFAPSFKEQARIQFVLLVISSSKSSFTLVA